MYKKYIIEIDEKPLVNKSGPALYRAKGFASLVFDDYGLEKLTPLTDEDGSSFPGSCGVIGEY